jgi:hypothetical protein
MAHQSYAEEQTKIAKEAAFATLGRAIADAISGNGNLDKVLIEAASRRKQEQDGTARSTSGHRAMQFAALTRQVGDALNVGNPVEELLKQLVDLRSAELR